MKYKRYSQLAELVKENDCKIIVEVGTHKGTSALRMIKGAMANGTDPKNIYYYGFDLFELMTKKTFKKEVSKWPPSEKVVSRMLSKTGSNIKLYKGYSKDTLPEFVKEGIEPDIIYIDGGHSIETLKSDWDMVKKTITNNTIVVFDDYISNFNEKKYGCNGIVDKLDRNEWDVTILPKEDIINEHLTIKFVQVTKK